MSKSNYQTTILPTGSPIRPCPQCRTPNRVEARFCRSCGATMDEETPLPETSTPPPAPVEHVYLETGMLVDNRYTVVQQIGEGGMGRVFLAVDRAGRKYVLKQMREPEGHTENAEYEVYLRSFQREANILSSLPHPYLPIARDFVITPQNPIIVMDYVEGRTLAEILEQSTNPLSENRVLRWAIQVCDALSYLHSKKPPIIHRNIKPKNIILEEGEDERVRLIGFGLARYYIDDLECDEDTLGTQGYSPPEQYGAAQTDARSDIFGLGATLYALLSRGDPAELVQFDDPEQVQFSYPDLHSINPRTSHAVSQVVMKALQAEPARRYQTADEMKAALQAILDQRQSGAAAEKYILNRPVSSEETFNCEFKEIRESEPSRAISRLVDKYVVAYLNSEGGRIYWGIRDEDRVVIGVEAGYRERDEIRKCIMDKIMRIQPSVSPSAYRINFHKVFENDQPVRDLYIVEVVVPRLQTNLLYFTSDGEVYVKTEAGKKRLTGTEIQDEIIRRLQRGARV